MIDFLAIGPPKTGTTYLQSLLIQNPGIFLSEKKEIQYFNYNLDKGIEWYHAFFNDKKDNQVAGEISPTYSESIDTLKAIKQYSETYNKDMKIILTYREPVKRLLSEYYHHVRRSSYNITLQEAIDKEVTDKDAGNLYKSLRNSLYNEIMDDLNTLFKPGNILLIDADAEIYNSAVLPATLKKIETFLNVKHFENYDLNVEANVSYTPKSYMLQKIVLQDNPFKRVLKSFVPSFKVRDMIRKKIRSLNTRAKGYDADKKADEKVIAEIFDKYIKADFELFLSKYKKN